MHTHTYIHQHVRLLSAGSPLHFKIIPLMLRITHISIRQDADFIFIWIDTCSWTQRNDAES